MARSRRTLPAYGGYLQSELPEADHELTQVARRTPGGEYLRRFWHPIALTRDIGELPKAVRVLGEDLVAFRDRSGRFGLLHRHCAHRRTSLEYGIPAERGLRCCYHGWVFDIDGRVLEAPAEPRPEAIAKAVVQGAYPVIEYRGLLFAYLGHPAQRPAFPRFDVFELPKTHYEPYEAPYAANWIQVTENNLDPAHVVFLHTRISDVQFNATWGLPAKVTYLDLGETVVSLTGRRVGDNIWTRINEIRLPSITMAGAIYSMEGKKPTYFGRTAFIRWTLPVDDEHSRVIGWALYGPYTDPKKFNTRAHIEVLEQGEPFDRPYAEVQRRPGDFAAVESQGPVAIHAAEHRGASDEGVVRYRKRLRKEIRATPRPPTEGPEDLGQLGAIQPTWAGDVVLRIPVKPGEDDVELRRRVGLAVFDVVRAADGLHEAERRPQIEGALRDLERSYQAGRTSTPRRRARSASGNPEARELTP